MDLKGKAHKFGDDINTDYIMSSRHRTQTLDYTQLAKHLMEDIRPGFYANVQPGDFIVARRTSDAVPPANTPPRSSKPGGFPRFWRKLLRAFSTAMPSIWGCP